MVLETFLKAMGGKHHKTIIIEDKPMQLAIKDAMKNTIHRNCFSISSPNATAKMEITL